MNRFTIDVRECVASTARPGLERELRELVARLAAEPERWRALVRHDTGQRHFEQLWRDGDVDVWVISWANGNDTGFHDHDVSSGAVAVVEGEVIEERLALGGAPRELRHRAGETFDFDAVARAPDAAGQRHARPCRSTPTRRRCGGWAAT